MGDRNLYLGKTFDSADKTLGEVYSLDADDLTTHGFVVGMTGSGKTGLSIVLIEELLRQGIPVVAIDPKGDLANMALAFDRLAPEQFAPWVPPEEGGDGGSVARTWANGLADWGIDAGAIGAYVKGRTVTIITPGSSAGTSLNVLNSLQPSGAAGEDVETVHEEIDSIVTGLLDFIDVDADPVASREYILLFTLIESAWKEGRALDLTSLVGLVANPPIEKVGALPLEAFFAAKDRTALMMKLNNLVASPPFEAWRTGEPIDFERWLNASGGATPLTVIYTAHLDDRERMFATTLVLTKLITWMRSQPGRDSLRCLLYMDEVFGYFPPVANPPSKQPLLTLLKQARAYGMGVVLATQNPVDVDYKGLANIGYWAIGRLQTPQDRARVAGGIREALAEAGGPDLEDLLSRAQKRVFLIHNAHVSEPQLIHTRWAMSYLRGPVTRDEIRRLSADSVAESAPGPARTSGAAVATSPIGIAPVATPSTVPAIPGCKPLYLRRDGEGRAAAHVWIKAAVRYRAGRNNPVTERSVGVAYPLSNLSDLGELFEAVPVVLDEAQLESATPDGVAYGGVPPELVTGGLKALDRVIKDRLDDALTVEVLYDPETKTWGELDEHENDLALRITALPAERQKRDRLEQRLAKKRSDLAIKSEEISGRRMEKWASFGSSLLSNLSIFTGRKRTVTGVGGVLSKSRMENTARQRKARLEEEITELEQQIEELGEVDPARFERRTLKPARADVSELRRELVWVY